MMRINTSYGNITLDVVSNFVLFDYCITIFNNKDTLFSVFVNFIALDGRKGQFFNFYAGFTVKAYQVIADQLCFVVLSFDQYSIQMISSNPYIFTNDCSTEKLLVASTNNTVLIILLDFVERNQRKSRINLYSFLVLAD
jgi:hypothetical protein